LPLPFKKAFDNVKKIKDINISLIAEHKSTRVSGKPRDFIDCYLDELDKVRVFLLTYIRSVQTSKTKLKSGNIFLQIVMLII